MVELKYGNFINGREQSLVWGHTVLDKPAKCVLIFQHGVAESMHGYQALYDALADNDIACFSYDVYGHGKSDPLESEYKSFIDNFEHLLDDLDIFLKTIVQKHPIVQKADGTRLPIFVGGQSMGGAVVLLSVLRNPSAYHGVLLFSAMVGIKLTLMMRVQKPFGSLLDMAAPKVPLVAAVRPKDMSQDQDVVDQYVNDPLNYIGKVKIRTAQQCLKAMNTLQKQQSQIVIPIFAVHGSEDKCTCLNSVSKLIEVAQSDDTEMHVIPGGYHMLLKGPEKQDVFDKAVKWMFAHME